MLFLMMIFGAVFGSFCGVLNSRAGSKESAFSGRSRCDSCQKKLKAWQLVPIFSFLFLRGRCAFCGEFIPKVNLLFELCGVVFGALAWVRVFGEFSEFGGFFSGEIFRALVLCMMLNLLFTLSVIDWRFSAVPQSVLLFVFGFSLLFGGEVKWAFVFVGAFFVLKMCVSAWLCRSRSGETLESMGEADVVVFGLFGAVFGASGVVAVFVAALVQLVFHVAFRKRELPFVPALCVAFLVVLFFEKEVAGFLNLDILEKFISF